MAATAEEIERKIIECVAEQLGLERSKVTRESRFTDLGCDSLDEIELVMEVEDEFEIAITDEEAGKLKTVGEAIDYVNEKVNSA